MNASMVEEYFLQVDKLFAEGEYGEGKKLLEEILETEPDYGRAHNHLGWLYFTKFDNYERAAIHFKLGIKFSPDYPASYINYTYLLNDLNEVEALKLNVERALKVKGINRAILYNELGRSYELNGNYNLASQNYKNAIRHTLNKQEMETYNQNMERVKTKKGIFSKKFFS